MTVRREEEEEEEESEEEDDDEDDVARCLWLHWRATCASEAIAMETTRREIKLVLQLTSPGAPELGAGAAYARVGSTVLLGSDEARARAARCSP